MSLEKEIVEELLKKDKISREIVDQTKRDVCKKYKTNCPPNVDLIEVYRNMNVKDKRLEAALRLRPVRSLSGVVNVSVLTKSHACPGECIYCPAQEGAPKSYLDNEPAVMRAKLNHFDPKKQVQNRITSLTKTGHPTDKVEVRIVGETWSYYSKEYREEFVKPCFEALNEKEADTLKQAQKENETADHKMVTLSIETRPDYIDKEEIKHLRKLGITMVEIGVQSVYEDVLKKNKRGHGVKETVEATKKLKDAGFKVCYQVMPDLPGSTFERDLEMFKILFQDQRFKPDFLKVYPCMVLKEAPLYDLYKSGDYAPYNEEELIKLLSKIKKEIIPYWVRIQRVIRDIPAQSVVAGGGSSNLREKLSKKAKREGWRCNCIRCREVKDNYDPNEDLRLFKKEYKASEGKEIVLTFENKERTKLFSLLRMRIPKDPYPEVLENSTIIREIHTYGQQTMIKNGEILATSPQHKGLGKKLVKEAEKLAPTNKISVISGVGARGYWRKNGYKLKDTYMIKSLNN
ncbi:MAG: elongator complex protein 3 [Patescibacteria group bacterium]